MPMFGGGEGYLAALAAKGQGLQNENAQMDLNQRKQMMQLMQRKQQGGGQQQGNDPTAMADQLDQIAEMALSTGNVEQAIKVTGASSQIRQRVSKAQADQVTARIKSINAASTLLDDVTDEASWYKANAQFQMMTGQPAPFANVPYSQETVEKLKKGLASAKDKAAEKLSNTRATESAARVPLIEAQTRLANARTQKIDKAGGTTKPTTADLKAATDFMERDYNIPPEESRIYGRQITERANELLRQNPALRKSEAVARAYHEKKATGVFGRYGGRNRKQLKEWKLPDGSPMQRGMMVDGFTWNGGDPTKKSSWERGGGEEGAEEETD